MVEVKSAKEIRLSSDYTQVAKGLGRIAVKCCSPPPLAYPHAALRGSTRPYWEKKTL